MDLETVASWVAAAFNLLGLWFLPKRKYLSVGLFTLSSLLFLLWALFTRTWAIAILEVVLVVLNVRTIYLWRKAEGKDDCHEVRKGRPR